MDLKQKKLRRSSTDRIFAGVIGGIAAYFEIDSVALRVAWILLVVFTGIFPGVVAYILMAIVMPLDTPVIHNVPPTNNDNHSS